MTPLATFTIDSPERSSRSDANAGQGALGGRRFLQQCDGGAHRRTGERKFQHETIAGSAEYAAAEFRDKLFDTGSQRCDAAGGGRLVALSGGRVTHHINGEDGRQLARIVSGRHVALPFAACFHF